MDTTRKHSEYEGDAIERYKQMKDDEVQMAQDIKKCQDELMETERERIEEESAEEGIEIDELMQDYAKEDRYHEYLVNGATLRCTQATLSDFTVSDEMVIKLKLDTETEDDIEKRERTTLYVYENPMFDNNMQYATVGNALKYQNVIPFKCNCMIPVDRKEEKAKIVADANCGEFGVCRHLMELNDKWDNALIEGTGYLKRRRGVGVAGVAVFFAVNPMTVEEEGITMTSVLFCKHGGIIYPEASGQFVEEKQEILSELEKDLLNRFYGDLAFENWSDDKKICAQEIWNKFYGEYGYDAEFVAGIIGNVYGEGAFGMLQSYKCVWSKYSSSLKGYMIIKNIEHARVACLVAPKGYGIGAVQWSDVDRKEILYENYQLSKSEDGSLSTDQLMEAELKTIYDELNGKYAKVYVTYHKLQIPDKIGDSIFLSTCIFFKDYEIPGSHNDVDRANDYNLAAGVNERAEIAQNIEEVPSIIKRIIAAKVAYEEFME